MNLNQARFALALAICLGLAACQPENADPAQMPSTATSDGTAVTQTEPAAAPAELGLIFLEPARMQTCDSGEVVAKWDVREKHPEIVSIEIWVGSGTENKVWIASTPFGEAMTGPWTSPGAVFVLKNQATGEELDRIVMQGPTCP